MTLHPLVIVAAIVAALLVIVVVSILVYGRLKTTRQGYPNEDAIEAAILPYVYQAILAAYKGSEFALDEFGKRLQGVDKAILAQLAYKYVPDEIKVLISEQQFTQFVAASFDRFLIFYNQNCQGYEDAVMKWARENK
jgi:hypothetical protein